MTKKILSTVAATALLATSAMAFDINTANELPYDIDGNATVVANPITIATNTQQGDALIFPAFFVGGGWQTTIRVINTSDTEAVVAKVVLYAGDDSKELRDFNIYLSANDVFTGTIKIDSDGVAKLISTDDSAPIAGGGMASTETPMVSESIDKASGYIEVIGCAATESNSGAHGKHANLRSSYATVASSSRKIGNNPIFVNGVITSDNVLSPNLKTAGLLKNTTAENTATTENSDGYVFTGVHNVLAGDVRITDTVNGKDMIMPAVRLRNVTDINATVGAEPNTLLFVEGEAANIADRNLIAGADSAHSKYDATTLQADANAFAVTDVIMTYGDSTTLSNNQLVLTAPFKRLLVNTDVNLTENADNSIVASSYAGVELNDARTAVTNYGYVTALALIFDESENMAQASQFSPANTPTMNFKYEVSASEGNSAATDNLSYYLNQAGSTFTKGFADIRFTAAGNDQNTSVIPTQMIATEAAGKTITNWIIPTQK